LKAIGADSKSSATEKTSRPSALKNAGGVEFSCKTRMKSGERCYKTAGDSIHNTA
jgi:hypothetical protein